VGGEALSPNKGAPDCKPYGGTKEGGRVRIVLPLKNKKGRFTLLGKEREKSFTGENSDGN